VKKVVAAMTAFVLVAAVFAGAVLAAGAVTAQAPNSRLALVIDGGDSVGSFEILRKKGVASVTNPLSGVYCVKPSSSTMALGKIVPVVGLDVSGTPNPDTVVAWSRLLANCPNGTIEIDAYSTGSWVHRNNVGFTLTVS